MSRQPHHSPNWGGARINAGRKKQDFAALAKKALELVADAKQHPIEFMLEVMADPKNPLNTRLGAAQSLMPYIAPKLTSTELHVTKETDNMSQAELAERLMGNIGQLSRILPDQRLIEGIAHRVNGEAMAEEDAAGIAAVEIAYDAVVTPLVE